MSHRGDLAVKIDEGGSPAAAAAKSDDKLKPPRLNASGPSPREEGRVSPRKTNSLTPRKHGPDEARTEKSTTPRKEGSQLQRKEVGSKPKGGFLASFFGDAQPSTSPVPERAESSPSAKGSKRRAGSTSMTNEQLVYIREVRAPLFDVIYPPCASPSDSPRCSRPWPQIIAWGATPLRELHRPTWRRTVHGASRSTSWPVRRRRRAGRAS